MAAAGPQTGGLEEPQSRGPEERGLALLSGRPLRSPGQVIFITWSSGSQVGNPSALPCPGAAGSARCRGGAGNVPRGPDGGGKKGALGLQPLLTSAMLPLRPISNDCRARRGNRVWPAAQFCSSRPLPSTASEFPVM